MQHSFTPEPVVCRDLFDGEEDLQKKINYYAQNSEERNKIAREGRKLFEENYDFVKHGNQIEKAINGRI